MGVQVSLSALTTLSSTGFSIVYAYLIGVYILLTYYTLDTHLLTLVPRVGVGVIQYKMSSNT